MQKWNFLLRLASELEETDCHELPPGTATLFADRVIEALSRHDRSGLEEAQSALELFYLARLLQAPLEAAAAARGDEGARASEVAAFSLGQIGIAHAIVARAASKRVDDEFERRLLSSGMERYIRLLIDTELSGVELALLLEKDEAEVSRRLKILRQIGAVECRREGNRVINFLTPAAQAVARARNMGVIRAPDRRAQFIPAVQGAVSTRQKALPTELQGSLVLVGSEKRRHA